MIAGLPASSMPPDLANGATSSAEASALAPASSAAPFDFILALEALAASAAEQQAVATAAEAGAEAGAEAASLEAASLEAAGLPELEDGIETDAEEEPEEGALGFLAGFLSAAPRAVDRLTSAGTQTAAAPSGSAPATPASAPGPEAAKEHVGNTGVAAVAGGSNTEGSAVALAGTSVEQAAVFNADTESASPDTRIEPTRTNELLTQASRATLTPAGQNAIATHVRDPRWAEDFGTRITTMVRGGESQAALQLSPVDLGPVDVSVTVRDSQATIHFGAAQAETRALIEASLPKLREMLAAQGFNLLDASVSQGFTQQGRPESAGVPRLGFEPATEIAEPVRVTTASGLLDLYA